MADVATNGKKQEEDDVSKTTKIVQTISISPF